MKKKIIYLTAITATFLLFIVGCNKEKDVTKEDGDKIKIMTSIYPIEQFAKEIGGDKVTVETMVPPAAEPHDFEPKAKDMIKLNNSDIFVYNGLQMEPWVDKVLKTVENKDLLVINSSKNANVIKTLEDHEEGEDNHEHEEESSHDGHNHGPEDPHIWLGLEEATKQSELIKNSLIEVDPKNKDYYEENYQKFSKELKDLKGEYEIKFKEVKNKDFITGHAAFAYLCRDFGLEQKSLEGVFGEGEVTPRQLSNLVNYCKEKNIKTVFMPDTASEKLSETLANEVGAKVIKISSLETNSAGKSYIETMRDNLSTILEGISGN